MPLGLEPGKAIDGDRQPGYRPTASGEIDFSPGFAHSLSGKAVRVYLLAKPLTAMATTQRQGDDGSLD